MKNALIPTLDINLVMQAHLTLATNYRQTCHLTLGLLPDNNQELYAANAVIPAFYFQLTVSYFRQATERSAVKLRKNSQAFQGQIQAIILDLWLRTFCLIGTSYRCAQALWQEGHQSGRRFARAGTC